MAESFLQEVIARLSAAVDAPSGSTVTITKADACAIGQALAALPGGGVDAQDAARYRWLRDPNSRVDLVMDKITGELESGFPIYEYRAGDELDAAIDAALPTPPPHEADQ